MVEIETDEEALFKYLLVDQASGRSIDVVRIVGRFGAVPANIDQVHLFHILFNRVSTDGKEDIIGLCWKGQMQSFLFCT